MTQRKDSSLAGQIQSELSTMLKVPLDDRDFLKGLIAANLQSF